MKNNKIIELPDHIIKKFFTSNFLENISYILKELLENSCDAKSDKIIHIVQIFWILNLN